MSNLYVVVYAIVSGGDEKVASCYTKEAIFSVAQAVRALRPDALGLSLHGAGLSGEVSWSALEQTLQYCKLP